MTHVNEALFPEDPGLDPVAGDVVAAYLNLPGHPAAEAQLEQFVVAVFLDDGLPGGDLEPAPAARWGGALVVILTIGRYIVFW